MLPAAPPDMPDSRQLNWQSVTRSAISSVYEFEPAKGKGSHGKLRLGTGETTVSRGELKTGTYHAMLKQLGISKEEF